jgi:response regulator of citrate/malate metabolism
MKKLSGILLIDDDVTTNFVNELLLDDLDVANNILVADSAKEGISIIQTQCNEKNCLELILLDINMPEMNGFEFLEVYKKLNFPKKEAVKIIMLTTSNNPKDIERLQNMPIVDFLNKPLNEEKVHELLMKHF